MINQMGQIEVPVGFTLSDGDSSYIATMPRDCKLCAFRRISTPSAINLSPCIYLACAEGERSDGMGVHFIKEGGTI